MADNETQIGIGVNLDAKDNMSKPMNKAAESVKKVTDNLSKLQDMMTATADVAEKLAVIVDKIAAKSVHVTSYDYRQNSIQAGKSKVVWNSESDLSDKRTKEARDNVSKLLEEQARLLKLENENYAKRLAIVERNSRTAEEREKARLIRAEAERIKAPGYNARQFANKGWMEYRSAHPEKFVPGALRNNFSYQMGNALNVTGNKLASVGTTGRIVGDFLEILGSGLKSPIFGATMALQKLSSSIIDFSKSSLQAFAEIESIKTNLSVVYGSQSQADATFGELSKYAIKSPFGVQQTSELAILLKQSGVYASDLMDTLKMLGDTAGGNMEKMKRIANNYAQIVSIGKASMLDMRQFAYAGIPIFEAVSKELGVSQQQLRKLISDGKVTADIIEKVFKDLTGVNGIFENATAKGAETLKARIQNLKDIKQLTLSGFGESIYNLGVVKNGVTLAEDVYQGLQKWIDGKNLSDDIKNIAKNKGEEDRLKDLISVANLYNELLKRAEDGGDNEIASLIKEKLEEIQGNYSPDEIRAIYASSYSQYGYYKDKYDKEKSGYDYWNNTESAQDMVDRYKRLATQMEGILQYIKNNPDWFDKTSNEQMKEYTSYLGFSNPAFSYNPNASKAAFDPANVKNELLSFAASMGIYKVTKENAELLAEAAVLKYKKETDKYEQYLDISKNQPFDEMRRGYNEYRTELGQTNISDDLDRSTKLQGSTFNTISDIKNMYEQSEERKLQLQEEQKELFLSTQNQIREISSNMKEDDSIDVTKIDIEALNSYLKSGAVWEARKLAINMDNPEKAEADRDLLITQVDYFGKEIEKLLKGTSLFDSFNNMFKDGRFLNPFYESTDSVISAFNEFYTTVEDEFLQKIENGNSEEKTLAEKSLKYLQLMTVQLQSDKGILDINIEDLFKEKSNNNIFIPLWKRLLSASTGISSNVINSTNKTLENYRDDMAVREMSKNFTSAYLKSGGSFESIQKMLTPSGQLMNVREGGETYQIDWKQVRKNIRDFSLSLSASTETINAYKSSLESEYNAYIQLAQSLSESESQDLKNQKNVTAGQMEKLIQDQGSQLINAFGEKLETEDGLQVSIKQMEDGSIEFIDSKGNKLSKDQVVLSGNLFTFLKENIPAIRNQIEQANKSSAYNKVFNKLTSTISEPYLREALLKNSHSGMSSYSSLSNEMQDVFLETLKDNLKLSPLIGTDKMFKSVEDMLEKAIFGTGDEYLIANNQIRNFAETLMNSTENLEKFSNIMGEYNNAESKNNALKNIQHILANPNNKFKDYIPDNSEGNVLRNKYWTSPLLSTLGLDDTTWEQMLSYYRDLDDVVSSANLKELKNIIPGIKDVSNKISWTDVDRFGTPEKIKESYGILGRLYSGNSEDMMNKLTYAGYSQDKYNSIMADINSSDTSDINRESAINDLYERRMAILDEMIEKQQELNEKELSSKLINEATALTVQRLSSNLIDVAITAGKGMFTAPFESMAKYLVLGEEATGSLKDALRGVAAQMLSSMGSYMAEAGFSLVTLGAKKGSLGIAMAGFGLAAAGGFASGLGGALSSMQDNSKDKDDTSKYESLADRLQELLEQARSDALYYENNLRHKTALGINKQFSNKSVNDAIIAPNGNIITTAPDDYLIATKTPQSLGNTSTVVQPKINFTINNSTNSKVEVEQQQNADGSIDFIAKVYDAMDNYIASSRSDNAFNARQYRISGRQAIR